VFRGNDVFDPDFTGSGAQPYNFDDWATQYNRFRVLGSRIRVEFICIASTNAASQCYVTCCPRHLTTSVVSSLAVLDDASVAPFAKVAVNQAVVNVRGPGVVLDHAMTTERFIGQPVFGSDLLQSTVGTSPNHSWFWHTSIAAVDGSTSISGVLRVMIQYDVEFFDRLELTIDQRVIRLTEIRKMWADRVALKKSLEQEAKTDLKSSESSPADTCRLNEGKGSLETLAVIPESLTPPKLVRQSALAIQDLDANLVARVAKEGWVLARAPPRGPGEK
jgi:hypothetical protein